VWVVTDCRKQRLPGARIKRRMKDNWLKTYDKFGRNLRVETVINDPAASYCKVERLAERQVVAQRSYAACNPARRDDVRLFAAVLDGNKPLRGFRNADIRGRIFPAVQDALLGRRQTHAVGRLLKRLHVRGLVAKVPRTRRWRVTAAGQSVLGAGVRLHDNGLATAI
jgi:hypothetical protein